jgi:hypothetical protein
MTSMLGNPYSTTFFSLLWRNSWKQLAADGFVLLMGNGLPQGKDLIG